MDDVFSKRMSGGTLNLLGNSVTATNDSIGALRIISGSSSINTSGNAVLTDMDVNSQASTRLGGSLNFVITGASSVNFAFDPTKKPIPGFLPWATIGSTRVARRAGM